MIQRSQHLRFALESSDTLWIGDEMFRQDLDGDVAPQTRVVGTINLTHAPGANCRQDFIRTQTGSVGQLQWRVLQYRWLKVG
jgi:hypothetical protein